MTTHHTGDYLPGFTIPAPAPQPAHPLAGQTLVITGPIPGFPRQQAIQLIRQYGGNVSETVKPGRYLVWDGIKRGQKLRQAQKTGVVILPASLLAGILRYPQHAKPLPTATDPDLLRQAQKALHEAEPPPPQGSIDDFLGRALS